MAATLSVAIPQQGAVFGGLRSRVINVAFAASDYAAGGYSITPNSINLNEIYGAQLLGISGPSAGVKFDYRLDTGKLVASIPTPVPLAQGRVTLVAGTATVSTTSVLPAASNQVIQLSRASSNGAGALGILQVGTRTTGTSFVINSTAGTDLSIVDWAIFPPGTPMTTTGVTGLSGRSVLVAGTVTPAQTATGPATQQIFLTSALTGGTPGRLSVGTRTLATSFVINSTNGADTSSVDFLMVPGNAPLSPILASGRATLVAGAVTVSTPAAPTLASGQQILLTNAVTGGTPGNLAIGTRVAGTSFAISSDNAADTSQIDWAILSAGSAEVGAGYDLSGVTARMLFLGI